MNMFNESFNTDMLDLSELDFFDAVKTVALASTIAVCKHPEQKIRCKVSNSAILSLISELPLSIHDELVFVE